MPCGGVPRADLHILPSPLLAASAYEGLADALTGLGHDVTLAPADLAPRVRG